jgi:hypothetical protein
MRRGERLRVCRIGNMDSGDEERVDVPHGRTNQERNVAVPNDYIALQRRQHGLIQSLQIPLTCKQNTGIHHFPLHIPCARMDNKPFHEFRSVWLTRENGNTRRYVSYRHFSIKDAKTENICRRHLFQCTR